MRRTILKSGPGLPAGAVSSPLGPMAAAMATGYRGVTQSGYGGASNAMFGPGAPPESRELGGDPRQYQYRPFWNMPTLPGEGRLIDYATLRQVAKIDPLVRKAIEIRKDQMSQLRLDIIARDRKDAKKARETVKARQDKIDEVLRWQLKPDGRHDWQTWIRLALEDHLVIDGVAFNLRRNMDPDAGRVSMTSGKPMGKFLWLEGVDAATIKPLLDTSGRVPLPVSSGGERQPAYQQFLFGLPVFDWTSEEMIYAVKNASYTTPYGFSAVEAFLTLINLNLRFWASMNAVYTDGTLPEGIVTAPEGWTPQQIQGFSDNFNRAIAGDPRALRKLHMMPHGVGWIAFKDHAFDKELARFLLDILCMAFDLTPNEMGFEPKGSGLGGKGYAESQERVQERRSVGPTFKFLADTILNPILWDEFGLTDLEWAMVDDQAMDEESRAKADDMDLRNGRISLDELVERDGGEPPGIGRLFVVGQNLVLGEPDLQRLTKEGAAALGLVKPAELDAKGMPVEPEPPAPVPGMPGAEGQAPPGNVGGDAEASPAGGKAPAPKGNAKPQVPPKVTKAADPDLMEALDGVAVSPDYGEVWWNAEKRAAWVCLADGDEQSTYDEVRDRLESLDGVEKVTVEAEAYPDDEAGYERVGRLKHSESKRANLMLDDLRRWEIKSLRALKRGRPATVKFSSTVIPVDLANRICARLEKASDPEQVKAAFSDDVLKAAVAQRWSSLVEGELALRAA